MSEDLVELAPLTVLGFDIGTYTGWDEVGDFSLQFYDYTSDGKTNIPSCLWLVIDYQTGLWQALELNDDGNDAIEIATGNIVQSLRDALK